MALEGGGGFTGAEQGRIFSLNSMPELNYSG